MPDSIPPEYLHGADLYIWLASLVVCVGGFIVVFKKARKTTELETLQKLYYAYANLFLSMALNRVFFIWAYYTETMDQYFLSLGIGYIFATLSFWPLIYVLEVKMLQNKSKSIFTFLGIGVFGLAISSLFLPDQLYDVRALIQSLAVVPGLIFFILYGMIIKNTTGSPRKKAVKLVSSVVIALSGYSLDSEAILALNSIPMILAPSLFFVGTLFLILVIMKEE